MKVFTNMFVQSGKPSVSHDLGACDLSVLSVMERHQLLWFHAAKSHILSRNIDANVPLTIFHLLLAQFLTFSHLSRVFCTIVLICINLHIIIIITICFSFFCSRSDELHVNAPKYSLASPRWRAFAALQVSQEPSSFLLLAVSREASLTLCSAVKWTHCPHLRTLFCTNNHNTTSCLKRNLSLYIRSVWEKLKRPHKQELSPQELIKLCTCVYFAAIYKTQSYKYNTVMNDAQYKIINRFITAHLVG